MAGDVAFRPPDAPPLARPPHGDKLTPAEKRAYADRIKALDPAGELVTLAPGRGMEGGTVRYARASGITLRQESLYDGTRRLNDEEYVRAYLVARLVRELGYAPESLELEHVYTIGRPSPTSAKIDVRVRDNPGTGGGSSGTGGRVGKAPGTFMVIEAKRPSEFGTYVKLIDDQLFAIARDEYARGNRYGVWYTAEVRGGQVVDRCLVIDTRRYPEHKDWVAAEEPGHNFDLPVDYGAVRKQPYRKGARALRTDVDRAEMTRLQTDLNNRLWGGKLGDNDIFRNFVKLLLAKIYDEKTREDGEAYQFQVFVRDGEPETPADVTARVHELYAAALEHHFKYDEVQVARAAINETQLPPNKIVYVVELLEGISIVENTYDDDLLGTFFEAIVGSGFRQGRGQFFTHANVARFMLYALELDRLAVGFVNGRSPTLPYIIDPACGSGTFLVEAMRVVTDAVLRRQAGRVRRSAAYVREFVNDKFHPEGPNRNAHNVWAKTHVYGVEDSEDLAMATKVNMILHGDGNAHVYKADGLGPFAAYPEGQLDKETHPAENASYALSVNARFDCVISNPPFSIKEEGRTLSEYKTRFLHADKKNSENLFLERWYQLLKPGGRMAVVLPDSVFDTAENLYIRLFLYRFFRVKAVVSLPLVTFQPYTPTKTSLLFAVKKPDDDVAAWDAAWREAIAAYQKLRKSPAVQYVVTNDQIRAALIRTANQTDVDWYPATNLLGPGVMPDVVRAAITARLARPVAPASGELDEVPTGEAGDAIADAADATDDAGDEGAGSFGDDAGPGDAAADGARPSGRRRRTPKSTAEKVREFAALLERLDAHVAALPSLGRAEAGAAEARATLRGILRDRAPGDLDTLSVAAALAAAYDDLVAAAELNYASKPGARPYANAWWCFAEVSARPEFTAEVLYAEADNVGYKRSKKHPGGAPLPGNHLFRVDYGGEIVLEHDPPQSILEAMRVRGLYDV